MTVTIGETGVFINDAMVTAADIVADNGVVHVIDAVLPPTPKPPLWSTSWQQRGPHLSKQLGAAGLGSVERRGSIHGVCTHRCGHHGVG